MTIARIVAAMLSAVLLTACASGRLLPGNAGSQASDTTQPHGPAFGPFYKDHRGYPIGQIVLGPDKNFWFADNLSIGRITPKGVQSKFAPDAAGYILATGPNKTLWFPSFDSLGDPAISSMTTSGSITNFPIPSGVFVIALALGPDNNEWFADNGHDAIGKMTPSGVLTEYELPDAQTHMPVGISKGPDGNVWFLATDSYGTSPEAGKVTPSGTITEYQLPLNCSNVTDAIVSGNDGNLWISAFCDAYAMVSMSTAGASTAYAVSAPMFEMSVGTGNELWGTFERYIVKFDTATHATARVRTPTVNGHRTLPWQLAQSARGDLWFTANTPGHLAFVGVYHRHSPHSGQR
ncbi:MAG: hypothetical protein WB609_07750 [Candidatus Cybelea sp.]